MMQDQIPKTQNWVTEALDFCIQKTHHNTAMLDSFPERAAQNGWICVDNGGWVGGHWVGILWLAYCYTKDPSFETNARRWAARLTPRRYDTNTHDLGFLFELSHILGYHLTGDESLVSPALQAARTLLLRFNSHGEFIQAWGSLDAAPELRGRTIIDTMMNLDLLFWSSQQTGDSSFADCALRHAHTTQKYHLRSDFSTAHVVDFNPESGEFIRQDTHQGLSPTSCWSRGQSWAVYGFGDCYRASESEDFLKTAKNLAAYALYRLPEDLVPFWDYDSPDIPEDVRDSSAAAILASALLKLGTLESDDLLTGMFRKQGEEILHALWQSYSSRGSEYPSILIHGTRSKPHGMQDQGLIYGDYYFLEALLLLQNSLPEGFA